MKIILAAGEAVPYCKTGGLADVAGTLARNFSGLGHDVCLFLPKYRGLKNVPARLERVSVEVSAGTERRSLSIASAPLPQPAGVSGSLRLCLVDDPALYDRDGLYNAGGKDHPDNDLRFIIFCRAVLEGAKAIEFRPDIIHAHDWQAGLVPAYLKRHHRDDPFFARAAGVMTIHNMAYQGNFPRESAALAGFGPEDFNSEALEFYGKMSFLKAGIAFADRLTAVSPTYAREIQESAEKGFGMEGLLSRRRDDLVGILNGLDVDFWNPKTDKRLPKKFDACQAAAGKAACKKALRDECGLRQEPQKPLAAVISRFDYQKGLDLAIAALEPRLDRCQLAVLGDGDSGLAQAFSALAQRHPGAVFLRHGFDEILAHRIYAAADLFLIPSRFEPCGLGQMIAMRYGGIPLAAKTGGLCDTVFEAAAAPGRCANGFLCAPNDGADLARALDRALAAWGTADWAARVSCAMSGDYSWDKSVPQYLSVYESALMARESRP
ncbi:MAG TPA: glycogen/starch synthase [Elusimicrobiota bacterium]|nr:glycogen/starch synthase [Elusimicrobiota bacterium]